MNEYEKRIIEQLKNIVKEAGSRYRISYKIGISDTALKNFLLGNKTKDKTKNKIYEFVEPEYSQCLYNCVECDCENCYH